MRTPTSVRTSEEHDSYQKSLERLMRDLRIEKQDSSSAKTMIGRDAQED